MMRMELYHSDIGIPPHLLTNYGVIKLEYSRHALESAKKDRYGVIRLPNYLDTRKAKVIEVEAQGRYVAKVVYRISYNQLLDLVIAIIPENGRVKTVWLNLKSDEHSTLDRSRYN